MDEWFMVFFVCLYGKFVVFSGRIINTPISLSLYLSFLISSYLSLSLSGSFSVAYEVVSTLQNYIAETNKHLPVHVIRTIYSALDKTAHNVCSKSRLHNLSARLKMPIIVSSVPSLYHIVVGTQSNASNAK